MKPELIITDWNGTLIEDLNDKPVLKQIAMDELKHCAKRPWQWKRATRLLGYKTKLEKNGKTIRKRS